jgi:transcriptional regulator with XRE-family HTH domain
MRARDDIAAHLKRLRQHHDPPLTQVQAAELVGVDIRHYGNWERGRSTPRVPNLRRIAQAFDIQPHELLEPIAQPTDTSALLQKIETMLAEVIERLDEHGLTLPTPSQVAEQAARRIEQQHEQDAAARPRTRRSTTAKKAPAHKPAR